MGISNDPDGTDGGFVQIVNSTFSESIGNPGGGMYNTVGTVEFFNTILDDGCLNVGSGSSISFGYNIGDGVACNLSDPRDIPNDDPLLAPLADNGGYTKTHALLTGSPAIDAIPVADCADNLDDPIITDQRGVARPQGAACDIGAFETTAAVG